MDSKLQTHENHLAKADFKPNRSVKVWRQNSNKIMDKQTYRVSHSKVNKVGDHPLMMSDDF